MEAGMGESYRTGGVGRRTQKNKNAPFSLSVHVTYVSVCALIMCHMYAVERKLGLFFFFPVLQQFSRVWEKKKYKKTLMRLQGSPGWSFGRWWHLRAACRSEIFFDYRRDTVSRPNTRNLSGPWARTMDKSELLGPRNRKEIGRWLHSALA